MYIHKSNSCLTVYTSFHIENYIIKSWGNMVPLLILRRAFYFDNSLSSSRKQYIAVFRFVSWQL